MVVTTVNALRGCGAQEKCSAPPFNTVILIALEVILACGGSLLYLKGVGIQYAAIAWGEASLMELSAVVLQQCPTSFSHSQAVTSSQQEEEEKELGLPMPAKGKPELISYSPELLENCQKLIKQEEGEVIANPPSYYSEILKDYSSQFKLEEAAYGLLKMSVPSNNGILTVFVKPHETLEGYYYPIPTSASNFRYSASEVNAISPLAMTGAQIATILLLGVKADRFRQSPREIDEYLGFPIFRDDTLGLFFVNKEGHLVKTPNTLMKDALVRLVKPLEN